MRPPYRLVFFGTAELACASLRALASGSAWSLLGVVTQPDRPQGRALRVQPPPVKRAALELGLPVWQPAKCRQPDFLEQLGGLRPDLIVVAAYGQILPTALLELPPHGGLNVHASLLPQYRGAAPIQWALLDGQTETGVTIMKMDAGLDTGDILTQVRTPIAPSDTAETLHARLAQLGAELLVETIPGYLAGAIAPQPQPSTGVSYARKIVRDDGRLDWNRTALELEHQVRALTPWPGAYTFLARASGRILLKVWRAQATEAVSGLPGEVLAAGPTGITVGCRQGALAISELQQEGGRRLPANAFLAGHPLPPGTQFSSL